MAARGDARAAGIGNWREGTHAAAATAASKSARLLGCAVGATPTETWLALRPGAPLPPTRVHSGATRSGSGYSDIVLSFRVGAARGGCCGCA